MDTKKIPSILSLVAGLVTLVVTYSRNAELIEILTTLFWVLLSFYILGWIIKAILDKLFKEEEPDPEEEEEGEEELENIDTEIEDEEQ